MNYPIEISEDEELLPRGFRLTSSVTWNPSTVSRSLNWILERRSLGGWWYAEYDRGEGIPVRDLGAARDLVQDIKKRLVAMIQALPEADGE